MHFDLGVRQVFHFLSYVFVCLVGFLFGWSGFCLFVFDGVAGIDLMDFKRARTQNSTSDH